MVMVNTKIYQKMQKQKLFEYRKNYYKMKKKLTTVIRNCFHLGNLFFSEEQGFFFRIGLGEWARQDKKLFLLVENRISENQVNFFISRLGLESLLRRINQQSSQSKRGITNFEAIIFFILCLISIHLRV